jgi:hypothetical protein
MPQIGQLDVLLRGLTRRKSDQCLFNAEEADEFTKNALTQLLESSHVIRGFQVNALRIDLPAESDDFFLVFGDPKPAMNHRLVDF